MTSIDKIRLLVVDDSFFMRKMIREILEDVHDIEIVGEAKDGIEALELVFSLEPDVVTMDYNMPEMDGEQATIKILHSSKLPPAIIMLSASTKEGAEITLRCLRAGAIDFISKPSGEVSLDIDIIKQDLVEKIRVAALARMQDKIDKLQEEAVDLEKNIKREERFVKAIVIGSSTGGPPVVEDILSNLPGNISVPVFVVQHMPPEFTASFAERLDKYSAVRVKEAAENDIVRPGQCYLARGGWHMEVKLKEKTNNEILLIHLTQEEKQCGYRPSINVTMETVANIFRSGTLGIIVTGMGDDGSKGMKYIKEVGGHTIVQSPETAAIDSMPKAVINHGAADEILNIEDIVKRITELIPENR